MQVTVADLSGAHAVMVPCGYCDSRARFQVTWGDERRFACAGHVEAAVDAAFAGVREMLEAALGNGRP